MTNASGMFVGSEAVRSFRFWVSLSLSLVLLLVPESLWADLPGGKTPPKGKDLVELLQKRDQAAIKGLRWMDAFLGRDDHFQAMPFEAYHFFYVCAATSTDPLFRRLAQKAADRYAGRLKNHCRNLPDPMKHYDFLQLLEFLSKRGIHSRQEVALLNKALKNYALYRGAADLYRTPIGNLQEADWKGVYETLIYAYFLEKADLAFPGRFPVDYRLADILLFLKNKPYVHFADDSSADKKKAIEDAFMITHIAYILSNFSELRLCEQDAPWLYDYLRANFDAILAIGHLDLIGECVDVFRSLGYTEADCEIVRKGTAYLIARQNADGSWGNHAKGQSVYDKMHPTSCAVWALRPRRFLKDTNYEKRISTIVRRLNEEPRLGDFPPSSRRGISLKCDEGQNRSVRQIR
jgi:hypothetical protein